MKRILLLLLALLAINYAFAMLHIALFQSQWPFAAWGSIALHLVAVIVFPYTKFFTILQTKSK